MKMGRLIVLEGTDGSGKGTQTKLLYERLQREGTDCRKLEFPRYGQPSAAAVELYLNGALGEKQGDVNGYAASAFFAVDRYCSWKQDWGGYYAGGGLLLADRYTTSNAVHQASKLDRAERKVFLDWLFEFEYGLLGLPAPTAVFYLDVPTGLTERMLRRREAETRTSADIHERDEAYLLACRETGEQLVEDYGWQRIDCACGDSIRSIADIHEELYRRVMALLQACPGEQS